MEAGKKTDERKKSTRTTVSLPTVDYEELEQIARRKKVSVAWVMRDAVEKYLVEQSPSKRE